MANNNYTDKHKTLIAAEDLIKYRRVKLDGSQEATYADAGEDALGVTMGAASDGEPVAIKLFNDSGSFIITASAAVTAGAVVYGAADGKVDDAQIGDPIGWAVEAAGAANADLEIVLFKHSGDGQISIGASTAFPLPLYTDKLVQLYTSNASTDGSNSVKPLYMKNTMAGIGGVGGRAEFHMYTNVALGGWSNAIKGFAEYGSAGRTAGLGSGICGEVQLSAGTSSGTYAALEGEMVLPSNAVLGTSSSFIYLNIDGADKALFDTGGKLLQIGAGITPAAGKFCSLTSQSLKCLIEANTRYMVLSQMEDGLGLGNSTTAMALGTSLTQRAIDVYTTSSSVHTSTSVRPIFMKSRMAGVAGVGGRAEFHMVTNVALGGWSNALKGYAEYEASGRTNGLGSAVCAEILLSAGTTQGTYAPLEAELVANSAVSTGTSTSFLYCNIAGSDGTGKTTLNTNGFLFELGAGIVDTAQGIFDAVTITPGATPQFDGTLKGKIGGVTYYIPVALDQSFDA